MICQVTYFDNLLTLAQCKHRTCMIKMNIPKILILKLWIEFVTVIAILIHIFLDNWLRFLNRLFILNFWRFFYLRCWIYLRLMLLLIFTMLLKIYFGCLNILIRLNFFLLLLFFYHALDWFYNRSSNIFEIRSYCRIS